MGGREKVTRVVPWTIHCYPDSIYLAPESTEVRAEAFLAGEGSQAAWQCPRMVLEGERERESMYEREE